MPFFTTQQVNLPGCSSHCPFNAERQAGKLRIAILKSFIWPDLESNVRLQLQKQTLLPLNYLSCRIKGSVKKLQKFCKVG